MRAYYIETSALLKRYRTEQGTETIHELFTKKSRDELFITSYFTTVEVEASAARALRARLLNQKAYRVLLGRFVEDISQIIVLQPVSNVVVSDAAELVRHHALRASDAVHLATALRIREALPPNTVFISSDRELVRSAQAEGFVTLDPQDSGALGNLRRLRSTG